LSVDLPPSLFLVELLLLSSFERLPEFDELLLEDVFDDEPEEPPSLRVGVGAVTGLPGVPLPPSFSRTWLVPSGLDAGCPLEGIYDGTPHHHGGP
jgi:hypothetical protein